MCICSVIVHPAFSLSSSWGKNSLLSGALNCFGLVLVSFSSVWFGSLAVGFLYADTEKQILRES